MPLLVVTAAEADPVLRRVHMGAPVHELALSPPRAPKVVEVLAAQSQLFLN